MLLSVLQANASVMDVEANLRTIDDAAQRAAQAGPGCSSLRSCSPLATHPCGSTLNWTHLRSPASVNGWPASPGPTALAWFIAFRARSGK